MNFKKLLLFLVLLISTYNSYSQTVNLNLGLQAHYSFSGNANDLSSNGNNGVLFGSPLLTTDRFGSLNSAYEFDGIDDYINTFSTFDFVDRSLSLWVNPYDLNGAGSTANVAISQDDDALNYGLLRASFSNGQMKLWAGGSLGTYTSNNIVANSWIHVVLIRQGNISKYYIDNVLVHTSTAHGTGSIVNPNPNLIIGCGRRLINQFFKGKVDDIRIYDRAINPCEIQMLYSGNSVDLNAGLQAYYPFSGNADDLSGNVHNGTSFGSPTLTTDRFGNSNSAYEFDGIDDYINTFSTFDYQNRSLSLWVNPYNLNGSSSSANVALTQDDNALSYGIIRTSFENGEMNLWAGGSSGGYTNSSITTNSWMHLVLIREGNTTRYYLDNVLVFSSVADGMGSTTNPNPELIFGAGRRTINQFFEGKIDDIRIYDRAINNCEIDSLFNEIYSNVGVNEEFSRSMVNLYPNPAVDGFTLEFEPEKKASNIQLISVEGKILQSHNVENEKLYINMRNYSPGTYFVRLLYKDKVVVQKVMKN